MRDHTEIRRERGARFAARQPWGPAEDGPGFRRGREDGPRGPRRHGGGPGGPFGGPFGGPGFGPAPGRRGGPGRGGRARRGDVRAAVLALLTERPMHGYEIIQQLADRTGGLWRPSPGSVYPALQLLEDEGLIRSDSASGKRLFELTDEGKTESARRPEGPAPWDHLVRDADQAAVTLHGMLRQVGVAVQQVAEAGTDAQKTAAESLLSDVRRSLYLLLAGESPAEESEPAG